MSAAVTPAKRAYGNDVLLLHSGDAGACERNLAKIAGFLGAKVQMSRVDGNVNELAGLLTVQGDRSICVMINADVLVQTAHGGCERSGKQHPLRGLPANTLVYGWKPSNEHAHSLRVLTNGTLAAVTQLSPGSLPIEVGCDSACRQLAGLKFDVGQAHAPCIFESGAGAMLCERLISIGGGMSFARLRDEEGSSLLLAAGEVGDLDADVSGSDSILRYANAMVPAMIAIRECLYPYVWHNEAPSACLIVDDPLLKPRYGALDYRKHLAVMDSRKFTTSIAFIPWNHRRTDRRVADLFRSRPDAFSLCIHGCDHTRAEFGDADAAVLRQRASLALERMRSHRALWGVPFDEVMVFPQGIFSTAAMTALRASGYLAAVNSTPEPIDTEGSLRLRDVLDVAVTRFSGFPLFTRRYPSQLEELAFDLFLGKPAFIVEHAGYFRDGYESLNEMLDSLHRIEPRLNWSSPAAICMTARSQRQAPNGDTEVAVYTKRVSLANHSSEARRYRMVWRALAGSTGGITVDGEAIDGGGDRGPAELHIELESGRSAVVELVDRQTAHGTPVTGSGGVRRLRVFARRHLSELRDNHYRLARLCRAMLGK